MDPFVLFRTCCPACLVFCRHSAHPRWWRMLAVTTMQLTAWEDFVVCKKHVNLDFTNRQQNATELLRKLSHDWILTLRIYNFYTYSNDCIITYLLTYSMEQSPSWEAKRFLDSQEIPRIWMNAKVHYRSHKFPPPLPILSQLDPVHTLYPISWRSILILSSHLRLGLPSGLFPSGFPTKILYTPLLSPIRATCATHLSLLDFITQKVLGEEYISLSTSLCSFLQSPVTSSLLGPNILLSTLFSNTLSLRSSINVSDQVSRPYKKRGKL